MQIASAQLARILSARGHDDAAAAVELAGPSLPLLAASREQLSTIYRVREQIQSDKGRERAAEDLQRLFEALAKRATSEVGMCLVSDAEHHYLIFLNENADDVLAVVVPPRRVDGSLED